MKTQLVTPPSNKHSCEISQRFGRENSVVQHDTIEIVSGKPHDPNFERLTISPQGSNVWLNIEIDRVKEVNRKAGTRQTRRTSESITLDKKQAEMLIENLQVILHSMRYVDEVVSAN